MRCTYCVSAVACVVLAGLLSSVPTVEARTNPAVHAFTELQFDTLRDVTLACSALSVVGTAFIVITYAVFPDIQTFPFKLIVCVAHARASACVPRPCGNAAPCCLPQLPVRSQLLLVCGLFFRPPGGLPRRSVSWLPVLLRSWSGRVLRRRVVLVVRALLGCACASRKGAPDAEPNRTSVIGFNILQVLVLKRGRSVEQYEKWYHLFCWGERPRASVAGLRDAHNLCADGGGRPVVTRRPTHPLDHCHRWWCSW